jgi:hypothetical protein
MSARLHLKKPVRISPIWVEREIRNGVNVKAKQERISISAFIRAALNLWNRGDPVAQLILEEARAESEAGRGA